MSFADLTPSVLLSAPSIFLIHVGQLNVSNCIVTLLILNSSYNLFLLSSNLIVSWSFILIIDIDQFYGLNLINLIAFRRSEEHTSELQSRFDLVCRLLLEKKNTKN